VEAPAAPSELVVKPLGGGAHLTWSDNSDNEAHFMVMRMRHPDEMEWREIATVAPDLIQYHDTVTSGTTYMYKVTAMNGAGAADSNEITFVAP